MNFDKFKSVRPSVKSTKNVLDKISDKDEKYIEKLAKIQYKKSNSRKIIQIVSTTAAAVMLVTAFSLWALLGRGIRGTYNPPAVNPGANSDSAMSAYKITVTYEGKLQEGREELQKFFDDCVSEKACTIEVTHLDRGGHSYYGLPDGAVPPLYTTTLIYKKNGSVTMKLDQPTGAYGDVDFIFNNKDFDNTKFIFDRFENKFAVECSSNSEDNSYLSFLPLDEIENKYENSQRVFDTDNTEPVTVQNGIVTSGEETLMYFFRSIVRNSYASAEINSLRYTYNDCPIVNESDPLSVSDRIKIYENGVETEFSKNNILGLPIVSEMYDSYGKMWFGYNTPTDGMKIIMELDILEIDRLGLFYSSHGAKIHVGDYDSAGKDIENIDELVSALIEDMPQECKTALVDNRLTAYIKLNDYLILNFYTDENGSLCDVFGIRKLSGDGVRSMMGGNKLLSLVKEMIGEGRLTYSAITKKQRLEYFDFARKYRIDYMPDFKNADELTEDSLRWQIYTYLGAPEELRGKQFKAAASELYGKSFDMNDNRRIPLQLGSYNSKPYMELLEYSTHELDDGTVNVWITLEQYNYEYGYDGMPELTREIKEKNADPDEFVRAAIGDGIMPKYGSTSYKCVIAYNSKDGYTPTRFLSCERYYKGKDDTDWQREGGSQSEWYENGQVAIEALEKYLSDDPDIEDFRIDDFKGGNIQDDGTLEAHLTYSVRVKEWAREKWEQLAGEEELDGWIRMFQKPVKCRKNSSGEWVCISIN